MNNFKYLIQDRNLYFEIAVDRISDRSRDLNDFKYLNYKISKSHFYFSISTTRAF
jgi:hypothetical protein